MQEQPGFESPTFDIDATIKHFLPPTLEIDTELLEEQIKATGGPEQPLVVWDEQNVLVDGHRRLEICQRCNLPYQVIRKSFPDRRAAELWIMQEQLSRRNVTDHDRAVWIGRLMKSRQMGERKGEAAAIVSEAVGIGKRTAYRMSEYERAFSSLIEPWQHGIRTNSLKCPQKYVFQLCKCDAKEQEELLDASIEAGGTVVLQDRFPNAPKMLVPGREPKNLTKRDKLSGVTPSSAAKQAELRKNPGLPEGVPSAMPEAAPQPKPNQPGYVPLEPRDKRIPKMIDDCVHAGGAFARTCDALFSERGLGRESNNSIWKVKIDAAHRQIARILDDVRDSL